MTSLLVIIALLIALVVTATLLIFIVLTIYVRQKNGLRGSNASLARVLDGLPLPIFEIDRKHRVTQWNAALENLSGIKKADVMGTDGQWRAFYPEKRPVLADLIADGASQRDILSQYQGTARKSSLIEGAYEAEGFFPSLVASGHWYQFTASPIEFDGKVTGAVEIMEDTTERHIAEQNLRHYVGKVTMVQEEEREYLAREPHDTTVQTLVALIHQLDNFLADKANLTEAEIAKLAGINRSLKKAVDEVRSLSRLLRPPLLDDLGLIPVLESLTEELKKSYGIDVTIETVGEPERLSPDMELTLFRIVQESLINAGKHAHVKAAGVRIEYLTDMIRAEVMDRGEGFHLPAKIGSLPLEGKVGLAGIEERVELLGGRLDIKSEKGKGTTVLVELPLSKPR